MKTPSPPCACARSGFFDKGTSFSADTQNPDRLRRSGFLLQFLFSCQAAVFVHGVARDLADNLDALRRLRFLTLDCFTRMRREEISKAERQKVVDTLRKAGLFPIAKAPYGVKYQLARLWVNLRNK